MIRAAVAAVLLLVAVPGVSLAENAFVEGSVFSKKTGVPLENAVVALYALDVVICQGIGTPCSQPRPRQVGKDSITDGNGFYSIEVIESEIEELAGSLLGRVQPVALCSKKERTRSSDPNAHRFELTPGVEIRNLYIDVGSRRSFSCDPPVLEIGLPLP